MVQDVTPDIAIKMSEKGTFLVKKDAKEVKFYKKKMKNCLLMTMSGFSKISRKFGFGMMKNLEPL